jgi:TonB family protein
MISYFLEVSICWAMFYLLYILLLSNTTFFNANRWYLLISLALGLMLPLVEWPSWNEPAVTQFQELYLAPITIGVESIEQQVVTITPEQGIDYWTLALKVIYCLGFLLSAILMSKGLLQIWALFKHSERERKAEYILVNTKALHLPFSFFNYLFWSEEQEMDAADREKILSHELAHIKGLHSVDVLFLELLCVLFWWNPMIYFYRHSIRNIHEFLADAAVLKHTHKKQYGHLLLRQFQSGLTFAMANNFIHSQLKKRIKMMTKTKSRQFLRLKYLLAIPLFVLLAMMLSSETGIANPLETESITQLLNKDNFDKEKYIAHLKSILKDYNSSKSVEGNKTVLKEYYQTVAKYANDFPDHQKEILAIQTKLAGQATGMVPKALPTLAEVENFAAGDLSGYKTFSNNKEVVVVGNNSQDVDEMPRFPGCENLPAEERGACSKRQLVEFLIGNLKYPKSAKEANIEGTVLVKFTVKEDGKIADAKVARSIGGGCDEAALALVNAMPNWVPGRKANANVAVEMTLPFQFKLPAENVKKKPGKEIFKVVEEMPRFPGCEDQDLSGEELKFCSQKQLLEFIYKNIRYPKAARDRGAEGVVVVQFVVNTEGRLEQQKIVRSVDPDLDDEVLFVTELMNEMETPWVAGKQRGKVVNVQFNLPVKFKLDGGMKESTPGEVRAIETLKLADFTLLPNPTSDIVRVSFQKEAEQVLTLSILDNAGKVIKTQEIGLGTDFYNQEFDLSQQAKGIYNLTITDGTKRLTKAIILQ